MNTSIRHTYQHKKTGSHAVSYEQMDISPEFVNDNHALRAYVPKFSKKGHTDEWVKIEMAISRQYVYKVFWKNKEVGEHFKEDLFTL